MTEAAMRTGGQLIVDCLKAQGVEHVFCVPGESYLAVLDALHDALIAPDQAGVDRRQSSPFATLIDSADRWAIIRRTREADEFVELGETDELGFSPVADRAHGLRLGEDFGVRPDAHLEVLRPHALVEQDLFELGGLG